MLELTYTLTEIALRVRAALPASLDIPDKGFKAPKEVKNGLGEALAFARWIGGGFLAIGLVLIFVSWGTNRRAQRGDGGEENAVALGWWIAGAVGIGALLSIVGWFL